MSPLHATTWWGNDTAIRSHWREQNNKGSWKYFSFWSFPKGIQKYLSSEKPFFAFLKQVWKTKERCGWKLVPSSELLRFSLFCFTPLPMFRMGTTYFGVSINFLVHVSLLWIRFLNSHMQTQTTISILLYAIKAKNPPLSLRRTCCRQSPSPLNHNLWLVLWGRREKCNQVQNANASLWGDRHLISKQPLKAPYGISCLYEARRNRKTQQRAHAVCSFCLRARGSSRAFWAENELWGWDVQHAWVLVHFIIVILTKKLAAWSIWRGYGFETDVEIICKHEGQAVEHFQDYMKY